MSELHTDPEARLDYLLEHGVIEEDHDGDLRLTAEFAETQDIHHDTYGDISEDRFVRVVADIFEISEDRAREQDVTRNELVAFTTLQTYLEAPPDRDALALLAAMVARFTPPSAVPDGMLELSDETYGEFLDGRDAVVVVWKRVCTPCDQMKEELDDIRAGAPGNVAFAGVDGEEVPAFRREFEVTAAPTTLVFADGELVERFDGKPEVETFHETFDEVYGTAEVGG
ncbi:thioredoxin family protein [Haloglomus litoreum]|uniref:thioredoxin family protein n=1 Tax=Haloglomus litoreum TaxID=3034026 RepID=UPI0023E76263|nr:thioredoxin family protein [Haloglomus sp. DT116]